VKQGWPVDADIFERVADAEEIKAYNSTYSNSWHRSPDTAISIEFP